MKRLLALGSAIDAFSTRVGRSVAWLIVAAAIIGTVNAIVRKTFNTSSNAWLEIQWWLFSFAFLFASPWTLKENEHIRIDIVSTRLPQSWRNAIEVIGHVFFLLPTAALIAITSWYFFASSYGQNEQAQNFGGLPQWPIKAIIPVAFALLFVQGLSELIKRVAIMRGELPEPASSSIHHPAIAEMDVTKPD